MSDEDKPNDYEVGYKKPPIHSRFKPGHSGNRKGRPRGSKNVSTLLGMVGAEKIRIRENGEAKTATRLEAVVRVAFKDALNGNARARADIFAASFKAEQVRAAIPQGGASGVLVVPAPLDPDEWAKAAAKQQAQFRGNSGPDGKG